MVEWITLPGLNPYKKALEMMQQTVNDVINTKISETIFLIEHQSVYTAGTSYEAKELLHKNNIPVIYTGRGGKFTYHGPGQRVIYPILNLAAPNRAKDLKLYIKNLENWIIATLKQFNVEAYIIPDKIGIWTDQDKVPAKIAAIGVRIRKWVTYHGIAVNINTDIDKFSGIIPCGINNFPVTSLNKLKVEVSFDDFDKALKNEFTKIFK